MIVRSRHDGKIERVRESQNRRPALLYDADAFWRRIAQLDSIQPREPVLLIIRDPVDVAGNRENEQWRGRRYRERGVAYRIVPVAFRVDRERRVDSDRDDVLVLITRFETGKQCGSITRMLGIPLHSRHRAGEALVIGDVRDIKARSRMPGAIALDREPAPAIP
jgi:hypothetical protein